jgi:hypothetical protein
MGYLKDPATIIVPRLPNLEPDQFWFALRFFGYDQALHAWIDAFKNPESPAYDLAAWAVISAKVEFAKYFERDHPFVEEARAALGLSAEQLDDMWLYGAA